ncbi:MAG: hypothetical protein JHC95_11190 [Solirubrobacteraceae bacterium]|nr:hypothetical protein [Solirubrobacteraceae bacterium]
MSADDADRALQREVAGIPVQADVLASAITRRAFDRTVVVEALLMGLDDPDALTRAEVAHRAARLVDLDPRVSARLTVMTGQDDDARVREAAADTLRAHGLPVPGEAAADTGAPRAAPSRLAFLRLRLGFVRGDDGAGDALSTLEPEIPSHAVAFNADVHDDGAGGAVIVISGLPDDFIGRHPTLRVARERNSQRFDLVTADAPVHDAGQVLIAVPRTVLPYTELETRLALGVDLEVLGDR